MISALTHPQSSLLGPPPVTSPCPVLLFFTFLVIGCFLPSVTVRGPSRFLVLTHAPQIRGMEIMRRIYLLVHRAYLRPVTSIVPPHYPPHPALRFYPLVFNFVFPGLLALHPRRTPCRQLLCRSPVLFPPPIGVVAAPSPIT